MNPTERHPLLRQKDGRFVPAADAFANEVHVRLSSEAGHAVSVLATPQDLDVFAVGHAMTEGWWDGDGPVPTVDVSVDDDGYHAHLHGASAWGPLREDRHILPSCGGCGDSMASPPAGHCLSGGPSLEPASLTDHLRGMWTHQPIFHETGGVHAAALISEDGALVLCEDIGRHTAVDKAIGRWRMQRESERPSALLLSGRCGWDLMAKAVRVGLKQMACVGAMSGPAAALAREHGILVMGFASGNDPQFVGPWSSAATKA